jgi:hypothetical protein
MVKKKWMKYLNSLCVLFNIILWFKVNKKIMKFKMEYMGIY